MHQGGTELPSPQEQQRWGIVSSCYLKA